MNAISKMNDTMKTIRTLAWLLGIGLVMALSPAKANVVTDNFDRGNDFTPGFQYLGTSWANQTGLFSLVSNKAVNQVASSAAAATAYAGVNVGTQPFAVQAAVSTTYSTEWVGLAFKIQDTSNYYAVRWEQTGGYYQVLKVVGGVLNSFQDGNSAYATGTVMKIDYTGANAYTLTFGAGTPIGFSGGVSPYTAGGVGLFYSNGIGGGTVTFDNFSATYAVPEPAALSLLGLGALGFLGRGRHRG